MCDISGCSTRDSRVFKDRQVYTSTRGHVTTAISLALSDFGQSAPGVSRPTSPAEILQAISRWVEVGDS